MEAELLTQRFSEHLDIALVIPSCFSDAYVERHKRELRHAFMAGARQTLAELSQGNFHPDETERLHAALKAECDTFDKLRAIGLA